MRAGGLLVVAFLVIIGWPLSMMAKEADVQESFENGLNGWKLFIVCEVRLFVVVSKF